MLLSCVCIYSIVLVDLYSTIIIILKSPLPSFFLRTKKG
uniref:Uncharacterized protein n=1 Tax=Rhizophora mucronata TaxID=61149 RepID=A0A2P2QU52_RHIMU